MEELETSGVGGGNLLCILGLGIVATPKSSTEASDIQWEVHRAVLGLTVIKRWFMGDGL